MAQIALPLSSAPGPSRVVIGAANRAVFEALGRAADWPFGTAILFGPPRSGKSLLARWFIESGAGTAVDDGEQVEETALFHRWNRAQEAGEKLLIVANAPVGGWRIALPDLASRLGAALHLEIGEPDDEMIAELISVHAEQRALPLAAEAADYLIPRCERSHAAIERLVATIDRLSLERMQPATQVIWREALDEISGVRQPRLF